MGEFPGGSKNRVNRAGANVRDGCATADDLQVIDDWRAAHRNVLNTFQAILRTRTRKTRTVVAQRHKRRTTIFGKLHRFPHMQLARMDDVAGCRLIFRSVSELYAFRRQFHKARFKHKRRDDVDKYDYIKSPKLTGYRGIHDVYIYDVNSEYGHALKGLMVEIQYRTSIQHAWATAVEVIGNITESQPKFQEGDKRYEQVMALASEILARAYERARGPFPNLDDEAVVKQFVKLNDELGLLNMLRGLNAAKASVSKNKNTILIFPESGELQIQTFRDSTEALKRLFELEEQSNEHDIVLVKADTSDEVRFAFKNYFSDAQDFINLVENGCGKLVGAKRLPRIRRHGGRRA